MAKGSVTAIVDADASRLVKEMQKATGEMRKFQTKTKGEMSRFNSNMKKSSKGAMGLQSSVSSLGKNIGIVFGAATVAAWTRSAVRSMAQFERQVSAVKAISGANREEMEAMRQKFIQLGSTTRFTSTEAAQLGEELARLGFSTQEIIDSSDAILALASAAGTDLARAAEVAAKTINQFGLTAKDSSRVADVMAKSFSSSALDIEKFADSMSYVGPLAATAGVSLEETAALLSVLADNGIEASKAGTGLRRIFLEAATSGKPFNQAMEDMIKNGISLAGAEDEVGQRAITALNILAKHTEEIPKLTKVYQEAEGAALMMASTMEDNLIGSTKRLSSTIDGLIQKNSGLLGIMNELVKVVNYGLGGENDAMADFATIGEETDMKKLIQMLNWFEEFNNGSEETAKKIQAVKDRMAQLYELFKNPPEAESPGEDGLDKEKEIAQMRKQLYKEQFEEFKKAQDAIKVQQGQAGWMEDGVFIPGDKFTEEEENIRSLEKLYKDMFGYLDTVEVSDPLANLGNLPDEVIDPEGYKQAVQGMKEVEEAEMAVADATAAAAWDIASALALEGEERKKAVAEAIKANAAMVISTLIRKAIETVPFPANILAAGAAAAAGGFLLNKIPALAEGGIVDRPTLSLIGEAGPEAVIPLHKMKEMNGGGRSVNIYVDGYVGNEQELGRAIDNVMREYNRTI